MNNFNWENAATELESFGGREKTLHIPKTGLAFFDVLRLYGAIEMYLGLSGEITISDVGYEWQAHGKARDDRLIDKMQIATLIGDGRVAQREHLIDSLDRALEDGLWTQEPLFKRTSPVNTPDASVQSGQRNQSAISYEGLVSDSSYSLGQFQMLWADKMLCLTSQKRIQVAGDITFLPIFEGRVDFQRVISPIGNEYYIPNILCSQVVALLKLKVSLFADGYAERLSGVVYNRQRKKASDNYSGLIAIDSTAMGRKRKIASSFYGHCYRVFRALVGRAWQSGKSTGETEDAFAYAYWLMQPERSQNLASLLTAIERQIRDRHEHLLLTRKTVDSPAQTYVKEIFTMTYNNWDGDHEAVRKLARAVAAGIYQTRQIPENKPGKTDKEIRAAQGKAWYDEVTMLRSAPTAKAFFERALILIEQGHRDNTFIGTARNDENPDVEALQRSIGKNRREFETFRDLFRMYLIQESTPRNTNTAAASDEVATTEDELSSDEQGEI